MKAVLPLAAVVIGVILLVVGFLWGNLFPPASAWSTEKDSQLNSLGTELKGLGFKFAEAQGNPSMHRGENAGELKVKLDEVKKEYDSLYTEFESARDSPANTGKALKWVGVIVAAFGAVFLFLNKQDA